MNVEAVVHTGAAPEVAPAGLADFVTPVTDEDGELVDWALRRREVLLEGAGRGRAAALEFPQWRASFVWARSLGNAELVSLFRDFVCASVKEPVPLSLLGRLDLPGASIPPGSASQLAAEVELARRFLVDSPLEGYGIWTPGLPGHLRTGVAFDRFGSPEQVTLVVRGPLSAVWAPGRGLVLRRLEDDGLSEEVVAGFGFDSASSAFRLERSDGTTVALDAPAGRLLSELAPGAAQAKVHRVPLTTVWADVLAGLKEGAAVAAEFARPLQILPT